MFLGPGFTAYFTACEQSVTKTIDGELHLRIRDSGGGGLRGISPLGCELVAAK